MKTPQMDAKMDAHHAPHILNQDMGVFCFIRRVVRQRTEISYWNTLS